jgi:hypothetical protein
MKPVKPVKDDPTIQRIRDARHRISEQNGHDPRRIVQYYIEIQKKYKDRIISGEEMTPPRP